MPSRPLMDRLKQARIFQVLLVYLGASWAVLQIADVLAEALSLPDWVMPVSVLLLLIGLIIILATAWVQSLPTTTAKEEAGEIPTDWEIAPADALESLKSGRLPHLTWGRAILGGIVALSLLFGGAGLYVGLNGPTRILGPEEVGADMAATGIAVVPFSVTGGEDLALWREGMVDLLSTNLDGMGGFRTIDSRTVMARWDERVSDDGSSDLRTALEAAAETGARYVVVGALVGNPDGIRVSADLYDLSSGEKIVQVSQEGSADEVLELTSALSVELVRNLMNETGDETIQEVRLDAITTTSLPALRDYLEGEVAFRGGDFAAAVRSYERAVQKDSLFALAWLRLSNANGWLDNIGSPAGARAGQKALALVDRLPARDQALVRASEATRRGDGSAYGEIRDAVRPYPDDPDLWFELGEYIYHVGVGVGVASQEQALQAFDRAVALDPGFGPYRIHPLELTIASGDRAGAERRLEEYREATQDAKNVTQAELAIPLLLGNEAEFAQAIETSLHTDMSILRSLRAAYTNRTDRYDRIQAMLWANRNRAGSDHQWILYNFVEQGALQRTDRLLDSLDVATGIKGLTMGWLLGTWSATGDLPHRSVATARTCEEPQVDDNCQLFVGWGLARSGDLAGARASARRLRAHEADGSAFAGRAADAVEGAIAMAEGRVGAARDLLTPVARGAGTPAQVARGSLADLELAAGNTTEAVRHYEGNLVTYYRFAATRALARIYDERGEAEQARAYYRSYLTITREGDQDLPEIVEARAALARLGG
jgi:tetratricopeptide (TPR) repeat protein